VIHGHLDPDFADVATALRRTLRNGRGGAAVAVYHDGQLVADLWSGTRDDAGSPWTRDTTALSFSTTKGVVATAAHRLAQRGALDLAAPVAEYWPEFSAAGKRDVRVEHLLDHSAGMHSLRGVVTDAEMLLDWERTTDALAAAAPKYPAGTRHGYHAVTYGYLVGEVLRRATGSSSVDDVVQAEVAQPLGIDGLSIGARGARRDRLATLLTAWPDETRTRRAVAWLDRRRWLQPTIDAFLVDGFPEPFATGAIYDAESPAVNGCFDARSLARMYSALATDEIVEGRPFLAADVKARATAVRTTARDAVIGFPMRWRLGYHLVATTGGVHPNGFGHFGLGGSGGWADPDLGLAVAMICNRMAGTPFGDQRLLKVGTAAARAARRRGAAAGRRDPGAPASREVGCAGS
jgi:CubicO group peptidase (beta-lactamase class C family)